MTGKNQHYIPRLLLRAFGIRPKRKEIWYFGRGEAAERRLIKRTASADFFYAEPSADGRLNLDEAITEVESDLAVSLNEIRAKSQGDAVAPQLAAAIVSHLAQRTAHVRSTFGEGVDRLLDRTAELFADRGAIEALVGLDEAVPTDRFRDLAMSELDEIPEIAQLGLPRRVLERMAFLLVKENTEDIKQLGIVVDGLRARSPEIVRDSHNRALGEAIDSNEYEALLRTFEWSVEAGPASGAILPDCVVIAIGIQGKAGTHLIVGGENLRALILAVSPDQLLLGRKPGFRLPKDIDYMWKPPARAATSSWPHATTRRPRVYTR